MRWTSEELHDIIAKYDASVSNHIMDLYDRYKKNTDTVEKYRSAKDAETQLVWYKYRAEGSKAIGQFHELSQAISGLNQDTSFLHNALKCVSREINVDHILLGIYDLYANTTLTEDQIINDLKYELGIEIIKKGTKYNFIDLFEAMVDNTDGKTIDEIENNKYSYMGAFGLLRENTYSFSSPGGVGYNLPDIKEGSYLALIYPEPIKKHDVMGAYADIKTINIYEDYFLIYIPFDILKPSTRFLDSLVGAEKITRSFKLDYNKNVIINDWEFATSVLSEKYKSYKK